MTPSRHAATPARIWVSAIAVPGGLALLFATLTRMAPEEALEGRFFALALTFFVIASIVGPLSCVAYRLRGHEVDTEDELADARCRVARLENDVAALSVVLQTTRPRPEQA